MLISAIKPNEHHSASSPSAPPKPQPPGVSQQPHPRLRRMIRDLFRRILPKLDRRGQLSKTSAGGRPVDLLVSTTPNVLYIMMNYIWVWIERFDGTPEGLWARGAVVVVTVYEPTPHSMKNMGACAICIEATGIMVFMLCEPHGAIYHCIDLCQSHGAVEKRRTAQLHSSAVDGGSLRAATAMHNATGLS